MPSTDAPSRESSSDAARAGLPLLLIVLFALGLRLLLLSHPSFWLDEVLTITNLRQVKTIHLTMSGTTPPLYQGFLLCWFVLAPVSEFWARLPSVLFGTAAVPLVYIIGRRLLGREAGLAAAVLLAVSPAHVQYSQETRTYSLMVLLALVSWWFLLRVLERESAGRYLGYSAATLLFIFSHNFAMFFVAAQLAYVLAFGRRHGISVYRWLIGLAAIVLVTGPWLRVLAIQFISVRQTGYWIRPPTTETVVRFYRLILCADSGYLMKVHLLLVLAGLAWWGITRKRPPAERKGPALALLGVWTVLPVLLAVAVSYLLMPLFQYRYLLPVLPPFLLLAAWGAVGHGRRIAGLAACGLVVVLTVPGLVDYYTKDVREPWREAAAVVENLVRPGDTLLFTAPPVYKPFQFYYDGPRIPWRVVTRELATVDKVDAVVAERARNRRRLWAVVSHNGSGILERALDRRFGRRRLLEHWPMKGIDIYCYRVDGP